MKKLRNDKLRDSRIVYMIISLVIAILLWMYVEYTEQPDIEQSISRIPVTFTGYDELKNKGLVLTDGETSYVTIKIKGTRSVVSRITADDIIITSDLASISAAGEYQRSYSVTLPGSVSENEVTVVSKSPVTVYLRISNLMTKTVDVRGTLEGEIADEYAAEEFVFDPAQVTVTGPQEIVEQVEYAYVVINKNNVGETIEQDVEFTLMSGDNTAIDKTDLTLSADYIHATLPIVKFKTLDLSVELIPGVVLTADSVDVRISPIQITISGDETILDDMDTFPLGTVDLGALMTGETTLTLPINLPQGMKSISGETEAAVTVTVNDNTVTQSYTVDNFKLEGAPEGFVGTLVTQSLVVDLRGTQEAFQELSEAEVWGIADLSSLSVGAGTYSVPVTIEITGAEGIGAVGEYVIYVQLTEE